MKDSDRIDWLEDRVTKQAKVLSKVTQEKERITSDDLIKYGGGISLLYVIFVLIITSNQIPSVRVR